MSAAEEVAALVEYIEVLVDALAKQGIRTDHHLEALDDRVADLAAILGKWRVSP